MQVALNFYLSTNELDAERPAALRLYYVDIRFRLVAHDFSLRIATNLFTDVLQLNATKSVKRHGESAMLAAGFREI